MSRGSIREYAQAVQERYRGASKKERGKILDEFTQVTGYHRKAAIRLLRSPSEDGAWAGRRGRPKVYDARIVVALRAVWEATDRLCSRRLHPFLPEATQRVPGPAPASWLLSVPGLGLGNRNSEATTTPSVTASIDLFMPLRGTTVG